MRLSAGILMVRKNKQNSDLEVLLCHPGGPFYSRKHLGVWSIPKGEVPEQEAPIETAIRECKEETGITVKGPLISLGRFVYPSGRKEIVVWACFQSDEPPADHQPPTVEIFWRGKKWTFPEVDEVKWVSKDLAYRLILPAQKQILDSLFSLPLDNLDLAFNSFSTNLFQSNDSSSAQLCR